MTKDQVGTREPGHIARRASATAAAIVVVGTAAVASRAALSAP